MKKYPKVPRHDLDFVPEQIFTVEDLVLIEKMDGMNFRFMLYEERFQDEYSKEVLETNPDDGEIVFGTKSVVRGSVSEPLENFPPELHLGIKKLRQVDKSKITNYQDTYGPITWFAENMVPHTLDYDYEDDPPPELIGFDVYIQREDTRNEDDFDPNPYKEKFVGYVDVGTAKKMFEEIGVQYSSIIGYIEDFNGYFNPEKFTIPSSKFASVQAEGVVIRSDSLQIRTKYVRESFREMHKSSMGGNANKEEDPEKWILSSIVTPSRIRKHVRKLVNREGCQFSTEDVFVDLVTQKVLYDSWYEEFSEIREIESKIKPSNLHQPANEKVGSVLERMKQMSARTDQKPQDSWLMIDDTEAVVSSQTDFDSDRLADVEKRIENISDDKKSVEMAMIEVLMSEDEVENTVRDLSDETNISSDSLEPAVDRLEDSFWTSEEILSVIWQLHIQFTPTDIRSELITKVKKFIENETGEDLDRGGGSWEPDPEDYSFEALDGF